MKNYKVVFPAQSCVELWEDEVEELKADQILVETELSQISTGTELTMLEANVDKDSAWWTSDISYPRYPGYSNVGKVVKVGKDVDPSLLGKRILSGAHHQKYVVRSGDPETFYVIPDGVESEDAVFGSLATVAMASIRTAQLRPGDTVVVYGAGLVGQLVARLAKLAGAGYVFVTDVSDGRLQMVPDEESFIKVNTMKEDVIEALLSHGRKEKARIVFETTSVPSLIAQEVLCLQKLGQLIITSSPKGKSVIDFQYCSLNGISILTADNWSVHTPVATPRDPWTRQADTRYFLELLAKKELSLKELHTHKENYKNAVQMYHMLMKDRTQAMSVLLLWED